MNKQNKDRLSIEDRAHAPATQGLVGVVQYTPEDLAALVSSEDDIRNLDPLRLFASNTILMALAHHLVTGGWRDCGCGECGRMAVWFECARDLGGAAPVLTIEDFIRGRRN
jgi:hypothetical protein